MDEPVSGELSQEFERLIGDAPRRNIHELNQLERDVKERVYSLLVPDRAFALFEIDREDYRNLYGERVLEFKASPDSTYAIIELREHPGDQDCIFFLEIEDTSFFKIDINFLIINDPHSPRFNTDIDEVGRRTKFATVRRNIPEEIRAMEAGLAPGQVRKGLRMLKYFVPRAVAFVSAMGQDMIIAEPLAYNNAIVFEGYGFNYIRGRRRMEEINEGFQPGGEYFEKLDGGTPFRQPGAEKTVRGRSWAIHDGILGEPWRGIEMYRRVEPAAVCTFPDCAY
ncbi:MAG: hypothetical protein C4536_11165 [Actinobacteria bacterium]|jgi:hypothetical protein|nr:MAG: hypothetical protein C4536_11165 [Actinomycetota bacterium]